MQFSPPARFLTIALLLAILAGLFVWAGTIDPNPTQNNYPGATEIHENPDQYINEQVRVGGTVTALDPLTIEGEPVPGETIVFVVEDADRDVSVGDHVTLFGTLRQDNHVTATNSYHRQPWELQYMFIVSFFAGLWVFARLLNRWTVDTTTWRIVPRSTPLLAFTD